MVCLVQSMLVPSTLDLVAELSPSQTPSPKHTPIPKDLKGHPDQLSATVKVRGSSRESLQVKAFQGTRHLKRPLTACSCRGFIEEAVLVGHGQRC